MRSRRSRWLSLLAFAALLPCALTYADEPSGTATTGLPRPAPLVEPVAPLCEEALIACFEYRITVACWYYFRYCQGGSALSLASPTGEALPACASAVPATAAPAMPPAPARS